VTHVNFSTDATSRLTTHTMSTTPDDAVNAAALVAVHGASVKCKKKKCDEPVVSRGLCSSHLGLERERERKAQASTKLNKEHAGASPVVLLSRTFDPCDNESFDTHMGFLFQFIVNQKPDVEHHAHTPSMPGVQELPGGIDLIEGKWRELRLNFFMGNNLELKQREVTLFHSSALNSNSTATAQQQHAQRLNDRCVVCGRKCTRASTSSQALRATRAHTRASSSRCRR
jgi:hypothetical protein